MVVRRHSGRYLFSEDLVRLQTRAITGTGLLLAGVLVIANALVSGPHAFADGSYAVRDMVVAGLLLSLAGLSIFHEMRRTV